MSLWKRISSNVETEQRMLQYYDDKGLLDIRLCFASWIEERIMSEQITVPASTEQYERLAHAFVEELKHKLISARTDHIPKFKLVELCALVAQISALELYTYLRSGIQKEIQLIDQMPQDFYGMNNLPGGVGDDGGGMMGGGGAPLGAIGGVNMLAQNQLMSNGSSGGAAYTELHRIHCMINTVHRELDPIWADIQSFVSNYNLLISFFQANPTVDTSSDSRTATLLRHRSTIIANLRRCYTNYESFQDMVISELKNWRRQQALAGNGAPFHDNLDDIQRCFEQLEFVVSKLLQCSIMIRSTGDDIDISELLKNIQRSQKDLVLSAFIVDKQPPQVMKTNTRFAASVRWLIGSQLGLHMSPPTVECVILSEAQALRFVQQRTLVDASSNNLAHHSSGEIQNNSSIMEFQQSTQVFSASFRNMQLKKIKRAEKKGTESVMDEKFALLFSTSTTVNEYQIRVWTLSLPVVVIVHGNQEPQSWATITWDNAFADITRLPFLVTDRVSWQQLSSALNTKFGSGTGRILTNENIEFLYEKLLRNDHVAGDHNENVSWPLFCKEPLPDRQFTFWDWFFAIMKLTKDHLPGLWKKGLVIGFINKQKATEELLRTNAIGTFLLRFSDSELGGISIAFLDEDGLVKMLQPWTTRDLQIRSLGDRIHDLDVLRFLHPTDRTQNPVPRDDAFGEFYTQRPRGEEKNTGYVYNDIKVGIETTSLAGNTPHHIMQSPHQMPPENLGSCIYSPPGTVASTSDSESDESDVFIGLLIDIIKQNPASPTVENLTDIICHLPISNEMQY